MKQNELFNKCCENIDPKTREEVWRQMDKELGRTELEQAAKEYAKVNDSSSITNGFSIVKFAAFKAGAEWQKKQDELTVEDMEKIWDLMISLPDDNYFPELLKRFKEYKEQKSK